MVKVIRKERTSIDGIKYELQYIRSDNPEVSNSVHVEVYDENGNYILSSEDKESAIKDIRDSD